MFKRNLIAVLTWALVPALAHANCVELTPPPAALALVQIQSGGAYFGGHQVGQTQYGVGVISAGAIQGLAPQQATFQFADTYVSIDEIGRYNEPDSVTILRNFQRRVGSDRVVEDDNPVPAQVIQQINNLPASARRNRPTLCGLVPGLPECREQQDSSDVLIPDYSVPQSAINTARSVVTILIKGQREVCNGVHLGGGRILTNLHCADKNVERTVLFGRPFPQPAPYSRTDASTTWYAPLMCSADVMWPRRDAPRMLRPDLAILELSPRILAPQPRLLAPRNVEFDSTAFAAYRVTIDAANADAWSSSGSLFTAQMRRSPYLDPVEKFEVSFALDLRYELSDWGNNSCRAGGPPPGRTTTPCAVDPEYANLITAEGAPHGCDAVGGSSGMPIFRRAGPDTWLLTGLHRGGDGGSNEDDHLAPTNWNCALRAQSIRTTLQAAGLQ